MHRIYLSNNSAVMFIKCNIKDNTICKIPDIISGIKENNVDDNVKLDCVQNQKSYNLPINDFNTYYRQSLKISLETFMSADNKYVFFTVDFLIEYMINLQYILVLDHFFKKNNITYHIILNTDDSDNTYFKIYHYFNMRYESIYDNVYVRSNGNSIRKLPISNVNYFPGEIFPYFNIDTELYGSCFSVFDYNKELHNRLKTTKGDIELKILFDSFGGNITKTDLFMQRYIYGCLIKNPHKAPAIIDFFHSHPSSPLLAIVLFSAIYNRYTSLENYNAIYESCVDYAFSLEQIIENSLFYANNGILSIRIHQANSSAMSNICLNKDFCKFLLEISLIDFQEDPNNRCIISQFIKNADADAMEKAFLKKALDNNGLKSLFQIEGTNPIASYFEKPNVIIQHYGLQTLSLLSQKSNSLLCVKSGKNYYCNKRDNNHFIDQSPDCYKYESGIFYRLIVPINDIQNDALYIGFNTNKHCYKDIDQKYIYVNQLCKTIDVPLSRRHKCNSLDKLTCKLKEFVSSKDKKDIIVINAGEIINRLQLEFIIKAVLSTLYSNSSQSSSLKIALCGFKNKTFIKLALRFIVLCYNRQKTNSVFKFNEIFMSTEDCKTQILISGDKFDDILKNLSSQRVFGSIDDEMFEEMKLFLSLYWGEHT